VIPNAFKNTFYELPANTFMSQIKWLVEANTPLIRYKYSIYHEERRRREKEIDAKAI